MEDTVEIMLFFIPNPNSVRKPNCKPNPNQPLDRK